MSEPDDIEPPEPTCKITQFGPLARGFKCVFLTPMVSEEPNADKQFAVTVQRVDAFGLGEMEWYKTFAVEPIALFLDEFGSWVVANEQPGYCGVFVDDETDLATEAKVDRMLEQLDPYYAKRIVRNSEDGAR